MTINNQSMMIYKTISQGDIESFRMIPLTNECPFVEAIYVPQTKVLAVISKQHISKPHMLPKLDEKGHAVKKGNEYLQQRVTVDTYYEYYIEDREDIEAFIKKFAINLQHDSVKDLIKIDIPY